MTITLERERTRKRRAAAKERGRKFVEAARARARKIVEAARARARDWLATASRPRVRLLVKEAKPTAKRRTKATSAKPKGKPKPMSKVTSTKPTSKPTNTIEQAATFRKALAAVSAENPPGALLSVREVRARARLPKAVFDALALNFASKNLVTLHHHDFPSSLSAPERAQLIEDGKGTFYIGIALRRPESAPTTTEKSLNLSETAILEEVEAMGGTREKPVRIPALRKRLALLVGPALFDKSLRQLQARGKVVLYRDDNNVTAEVEGAYFVGGQPRHILYLR
jgi:hypothetical protein